MKRALIVILCLSMIGCQTVKKEEDNNDTNNLIYKMVEVETEDYGIFQIPDGFNEIESGGKCSISYSDSDGEYLTGQVILSNGGFQPEYPDYESLITYAKDTLIINYGNEIFGEFDYSTPLQLKMMVDGVDAYQTSIHTDDGFVLDIYHMPARYFEGRVDGYFEVLILYYEAMYPGLSKEFIKSYQMKDETEPTQCMYL